MKKCLIIPILAIAASASFDGANGQLSYTAQVGGIPSVAGATLETFNEPNPSILTLSGNAFLATGSGENGQGLWYPPYYSGATAAYFGDSPANGFDASQYVVVQAGGSATMTFAQPEQYFGLLIGSVDAGNTLSFYVYNGSVLVGSITGSQFQLGTPGDVGPANSVYLNVTSSDPFTTVVASYDGASFEFDDLAYAPEGGEPGGSPFPAVPEPGSTGFLSGLAAALVLCLSLVRGKGGLGA